MLPVSGAAQLVASGARCRLHPVSSASGAYSSWVSPDSSGRKRFQRPSSLARCFRSSTTGGRVASSGPAEARYSSYAASAGNTCSARNRVSSASSSIARSDGGG